MPEGSEVIWLQQVLHEISASPAPEVVKTQLAVAVTDLSEICDRFVPKSQAPVVRADEWWCAAGWWQPEEGRQLSIEVSASSKTRVLFMQHGQLNCEVLAPNHAVMQSAVRSYFDRWGA